MNKKDLYVGMRVCAAVSSGAYTHNVPGTVIDVQCYMSGFDCLVEFDEFVHGHTGLGWGTVEGKEGHCYWFPARRVKEIVEEIEDNCVANYNMSYDDLMNGIAASKN